MSFLRKHSLLFTTVTKKHPSASCQNYGGSAIKNEAAITRLLHSSNHQYITAIGNIEGYLVTICNVTS